MNDENGKVKKFDWGVVPVVLVLGVAMILGLISVNIALDEYGILDFVERYRPSFQYRIWLQDMPEFNASNTYCITELENGDTYRQSTGQYADDSLKLVFFRETVLSDTEASYVYLRGWADRPVTLTISTYQSSFTREEGYVLGNLIKRERIRVTPWLFFFYSVEIIDVYVNTDLS